MEYKKIPLLDYISKQPSSSSSAGGPETAPNRSRSSTIIIAVILCIAPILISLTCKPIDRITSNDFNQLGLIATSIGLASYVSAVRLFMLNSMKDASAGEKHRKGKVLIYLIPADFNLILAALLTLASKLKITNAAELEQHGLYVFIAALVILVCHHIRAWFLSAEAFLNN